MQLTQLRIGEDGDREEEEDAICEKKESRLEEERKRGSETAKKRHRNSKTKEHRKKAIRRDTEEGIDTHRERQSEVEIEKRKIVKKREVKERGKKRRKEENKERGKFSEKGRRSGAAGRMMSSGLDSWKRHDSGVKTSDDDLENALTVGEFDGALTGLDLADNEINNNSISHWMSGKHKESLLNSPPLPTLSFNRPSPHHPSLTSTPCLPSINHHQQQQQQLSYHQFPSPVPSGGGGGGNGPHHQIQQIQPQSSHQRSDSGNFSQSDWTSFITSINLGQIYDTQYQYIVSAATTPCTKLNEETLTYLNQGQSYELKLKKVGDSVQIDTEQILKSVVRVIFHERRLQYMEREQLEIWKQTRPGERILDIDIPLSYGLLDVKIDPHQLSCIEFTWDPRRDSGVYIKVNAISTEFTPRRHGGEKGVPFRIQVETYSLHPDARELARLIHCASCQVKVFKPKGADRKYKTDREKIEKKSDSEREKFQPAFECTVLTEIPLEQVKNYLDQLNCKPDQESMSLTSSMRMDPMLSQSPGLVQQQQQPGTPIPGPPLPPLPPLSSQRGIMSFEETICLQSSGDGFRGVESSTSVTQRFNDASFTSNTTYASPLPLSTSANMAIDTKHSPPIISTSLNQSTSSSASSSYSPKCLSPPTLDHQPMTPPMTYSNSPIQQQFNSLPPLPHPQPSLAMCSSPPSILQSNGVFQLNNIVDKNLTAQCITPSAASLLQIIPDVRQVEPYADQLLPDSTADFVVRWLISQRFSNFVKIFQNFSGSDLLRLSREDLIEICGLADGIRLNNALRAKIIRPRLLIYVFQERNIQCDMTRGCGTSRSSPRLIASTLSRSTGGFPTQPPSLPSTPHCPSPSCTSSPSSTQSCIDSTSSALSPHPSICASPDEGRKTRSSRPQQLLLPAKIKRSADYDYDYDYNDVDNNDSNNCCSDSSNSNAKKISRKSRELCHNEGGCFAVYLEFLTVTHLQDKLSALYRIETNQIYDIYYEGPTGVRVPVTDSVVQNFTDHSKFGLETHQDEDHVGLYHVLMRHSSTMS